MILPMSQEKEANSKTLAELARIELTVEEEKIFNQNLKKTLKYMHLIDEVPTEDVLPCAHVLESIHNVMSEDEVGSLLPREVFLASTDSIGGMVKIPPVMQQEE